MTGVRVIPCLLIDGKSLVKTIKFKNKKYIGDPINVLRIFNEKEVDELFLLDITASANKIPPRFDYLSRLAGECFMPLGYGGNISTVDEIKKLFKTGFEKVSVNSAAFRNPRLVSKASKMFGSQSIVVSIDVKKNLFGNYSVYIDGGKHNTKADPADYARKIEELGAGEILLNSIDNDGMMSGYDTGIIKRVSRAVNIPVIACGGAGSLSDFSAAVNTGGASAAAAGSMFIYNGKHKAVLISYPSPEELEGLAADGDKENL